MEQETRIKRLLFRSAHRGTKESDLILGPYAQARAHCMDEHALSQFERFLDESDSDIWDWISGAAPTPAEYTELVNALRVVNQA